MDQRLLRRLLPFEGADRGCGAPPAPKGGGHVPMSPLKYAPEAGVRSRGGAVPTPTPAPTPGS